LLLRRYKVHAAEAEDASMPRRGALGLASRTTHQAFEPNVRMFSAACFCEQSRARALLQLPELWRLAWFRRAAGALFWARGRRPSAERRGGGVAALTQHGRTRGPGRKA